MTRWLCTHPPDMEVDVWAASCSWWCSWWCSGAQNWCPLFSWWPVPESSLRTLSPLSSVAATYSLQRAHWSVAHRYKHGRGHARARSHALIFFLLVPWQMRPCLIYRALAERCGRQDAGNRDHSAIIMELNVIQTGAAGWCRHKDRRVWTPYSDGYEMDLFTVFGETLINNSNSILMTLKTVGTSRSIIFKSNADIFFFLIKTLVENVLVQAYQTHFGPGTTNYLIKCKQGWTSIFIYYQLPINNNKSMLFPIVFFFIHVC